MTNDELDSGCESKRHDRRSDWDRKLATRPVNFRIARDPGVIRKEHSVLSRVIARSGLRGRGCPSPRGRWLGAAFWRATPTPQAKSMMRRTAPGEWPFPRRLGRGAESLLRIARTDRGALPRRIP